MAFLDPSDAPDWVNITVAGIGATIGAVAGGYFGYTDHGIAGAIAGVAIGIPFGGFFALMAFGAWPWIVGGGIIYGIWLVIKAYLWDVRF